MSGPPGPRLRSQLVETFREMRRLGLNRGTSGNAAVRAPGGLLITPSGLPPERMTPDDLVLLDPEGRVPEGRREPSSEWRLHARVLAARPDAGASVHAHPPYATSLACLRRPIPPFHYMVAVGGGTDIPVAPYATFGTEELADHVASALEDRQACLMANHGLLVLGLESPTPCPALSRSRPWSASTCRRSRSGSRRCSRTRRWRGCWRGLVGTGDARHARGRGWR